MRVDVVMLGHERPTTCFNISHLVRFAFGILISSDAARCRDLINFDRAVCGMVLPVQRPIGGSPTP